MAIPTLNRSKANTYPPSKQDRRAKRRLQRLVGDATQTKTTTPRDRPKGPLRALDPPGGGQRAPPAATRHTQAPRRRAWSRQPLRAVGDVLCGAGQGGPRAGGLGCAKSPRDGDEGAGRTIASQQRTGEIALKDRNEGARQRLGFTRRGQNSNTLHQSYEVTHPHTSYNLHARCRVKARVMP